MLSILKNELKVTMQLAGIAISYYNSEKFSRGSIITVFIVD